MSLFGSLFSGVSGLAAQSRAMSVISDNVANVNTTAYKGEVAQFASLVTGVPGSITETTGGVRALTASTISSQGLIQTSASPTDAAIAGAGFFVVNASADGTGEQLYTRAGSFSPDALGNLRTTSGQYLQGWLLDANGTPVDPNRVETVNVRNVNGIAVATTRVRIGANLDADQAPPATAYATGDLATYAQTGGTSGQQPQFSRQIQVFDSLGRSHDLTLAFVHDVAANTWNAELYGAPGELAQPPYGANGLIGSGTLTFNGDGSLAGSTLAPVVAGTGAGEIGVQWAASGGAVASSIALDPGTPGTTDGLSQFASPSDVAYVTQNGAEVGQLNGVSIDDQGYVVGSFTNGAERQLYRLPVAVFPNPGGLDAQSGNVFAQTEGSGAFNLKVPGSGGAGTITPSALEAGNVDLADEFTKMIVTQRAYSANAKVITTADDMLNELIQIRR
jgi:flagellar hook protein FlgE